MNKAEEIVKEGASPKQYADAISEVSEACKRGWAFLDEDSEIEPEARALLEEKAENHGLHAYRYIALDDGSVLAIFANDPSGDVKFKAFPSMDEAQEWSPRDERAKVEEE